MKQHSNEFKTNIAELGRQQDIKITFTIDGVETILTGEEINSATPSYEGNLLKSVMTSIELDSNVNIPVGTEIGFKYGLLVNGAYEYLNYGKYIVYSSDKKEDTLSYDILCYDKLLYSMKDYEDLNLTYPITVDNFINAICTKIGLTFYNHNTTYCNSDKIVSRRTISKYRL